MKKLLVSLALLGGLLFLIPTSASANERILDGDVITIEHTSNEFDTIQIRNASQYVAVIVTIRTSNIFFTPPATWWYTRGTMAGSLNLREWWDYRGHPQILGIRARYSGRIFQGAAPATIVVEGE